MSGSISWRSGWAKLRSISLPLADDLAGRVLPTRAMLGCGFAVRVDLLGWVVQVMRGAIPSRAEQARVVDRHAKEARARTDFEGELSVSRAPRNLEERRPVSTL